MKIYLGWAGNYFHPAASQTFTLQSATLAYLGMAQLSFQ